MAEAAKRLSEATHLRPPLSLSATAGSAAEFANGFGSNHAVSSLAAVAPPPPRADDTLPQQAPPPPPPG